MTEPQRLRCTYKKRLSGELFTATECSIRICSWLSFILVYVGIVFLVQGGAYGQTISPRDEKLACVSGIVTDASGAIISGATFTFHETSGLYDTIVKSNFSGLHLKLPPGIYEVTVSAPGFRNWMQLGLHIQASKPVILKPILHVGRGCDDCMGWFGLVEPERVELPYLLLSERPLPSELPRMKMFTGLWRSPSSRFTARPTVLFRFAPKEESFDGTITLVHSDLTETNVKVVSVTVNHAGLTFQTDDGATWQLLLDKGNRTRGMLSGFHDELRIEERVTRGPLR